MNDRPKIKNKKIQMSDAQRFIIKQFTLKKNTNAALKIFYAIWYKQITYRAHNKKECYYETCTAVLHSLNVRTKGRPRKKRKPRKSGETFGARDLQEMEIYVITALYLHGKKIKSN